MSGNAMKNPDAALAALTEPAARRAGRHEVRSLTLGLHALLQRIGSPLVDPDAAGTMEEWAETLFVLTRPGTESALLLAEGRESFRMAALEWADGVTEAEAAGMIRAAAASVSGANAANPRPDGGEGEDGGEGRNPDPTGATRTAGSPTAPRAPANGTGGPSDTSSGRCPSGRC